MDDSGATLFVVDDDPGARKGAAALASSMGVACDTFASAEEFLEGLDHARAGCVLIDLRLEGMSGLDLQERLAAAGSSLPVILISAYADVSVTVRAMQNGALTVLTKPYRADELADAIRAALELDHETRQESTWQAETQRRLDTLSDREHRLMESVIAGKPNKSIARDLGVSQRTVDRLRAAVFEKMGTESAVQVARAVARLRTSGQTHSEAGPVNRMNGLEPAPPVEAGAGERQQLQRLLDLYEHDRQLIGYEIHDGMAQQLTAARLHCEMCRNLRDEDPPKARELCETGFELLGRSIEEARQLIRGLRPPILDESGLVAAVDYLVCEQGQAAGPRIEFLHHLSSARFAPPLENALYRIIQEALTNACRHSRSKAIRVELAQADRHIYVSVRDWGMGFEVGQIDERRFGLRGIRERVNLLGGRILIKSAPGRGTQVAVELSLAEAP